MHNRSVQIKFDPAKVRANLAKHKASFAHAEQALRDVHAVTIEDPDALGEQRFVTLAWMLSVASWSWFTRRAASTSG